MQFPVCMECMVHVGTSRMTHFGHLSCRAEEDGLPSGGCGNQGRFLRWGLLRSVTHSLKQLVKPSHDLAWVKIIDLKVIKCHLLSNALLYCIA